MLVMGKEEKKHMKKKKGKIDCIHHDHIQIEVLQIWVSDEIDHCM